MGKFSDVKKATVALVMLHKEGKEEPKPGKAPFTIAGTGFCVNPRGLVVTCNHVVSMFMSKSIEEQVAEADPDKPSLYEVDSILPYALFYDSAPTDKHLRFFPVRVAAVVAKTDFDLALIRLHPHAAFPKGFPCLEVEDYDAIREGMQVATCGFPLGNFLGERMGTITSSFTQGIVSSVIPAAGIPKKFVKGFQLNLTATHGNSGGPVFSLSSGKVLGVLSEGVVDQTGNVIHGLTKAEPIYPLLENDLIQRTIDPKPGQMPFGLGQPPTK